MALDKGDLLMCSWGDAAEADRPEWRLDTEESIRDAFAEWRDTYDLFAVLWRQERWLARFAEIEPVSRRERQLYETVHTVDDARVATSAAKDVGIPIYCYVNVYDEGQPPHRPGYTYGTFEWQSKFFAQHPEFYACDRISVIQSRQKSQIHMGCESAPWLKPMTIGRSRSSLQGRRV